MRKDENCRTADDLLMRIRSVIDDDNLKGRLPASVGGFFCPFFRSFFVLPHTGDVRVSYGSGTGFRPQFCPRSATRGWQFEKMPLDARACAHFFIRKVCFFFRTACVYQKKGVILYPNSMITGVASPPNCVNFEMKSLLYYGMNENEYANTRLVWRAVMEQNI